MQDPQVSKNVKQFLKEIEAVNKTWAWLQNKDVYIRVEQKGANSYTDQKYFEVTQITQHVQYLKEDK